VERWVITIMEIFVFKWFQPVLFGLFEFDPEITLSVIDTINLRYRDVIAAKKGTCEPVPNNLVTANWIARVMAHLSLLHHCPLSVISPKKPALTQEKGKKPKYIWRETWERLFGKKLFFDRLMSSPRASLLCISTIVLKTRSVWSNQKKLEHTPDLNSEAQPMTDSRWQKSSKKCLK
jgi:hypothetical protein